MILNIIFAIVWIYLGLAACYMLLLAFAAMFNRGDKKEQVPNVESSKFAIFIPAYKEDAVIYNTVLNVLRQHYPFANYDVVVIADQLKDKTMANLKKLPIKLIEVNFEQSTKVKALQFAIQQLKKEYDIAVILDADNVMEINALRKFSAQMQNGAAIVQAERRAKNLNNGFAIFDGLSEAINNQLYNQGMKNLGLSGRLMGSGMAFDWTLYKKIIMELTAVGGFDKELELKLLESGKNIAYNADIWVYDEKVANGQVFAKQRRRWASAQWHYAKAYSAVAAKALFRKGKFDFLLKTYQMYLPARLLQPLYLLLVTLVALVLMQPFWILAFGLAFAANIAAIFLAIPKRYWEAQLLKMFLKLPLLIWLRIKTSWNLKGANQQFIHTPHVEH